MEEDICNCVGLINIEQALVVACGFDVAVQPVKPAESTERGMLFNGVPKIGKKICVRRLLYGEMRGLLQQEGARYTPSM